MLSFIIVVSLQCMLVWLYWVFSGSYLTAGGVCRYGLDRYVVWSGVKSVWWYGSLLCGIMVV